MASVLVIGVTGQQEQQSSVSAEDELLGGGGGSFLSAGGGTNPLSSEPSPAKMVPVHKVAANNGIIYFFFIMFLLNYLSHSYVFVISNGKSEAWFIVISGFFFSYGLIIRLSSSPYGSPFGFI